MGGGETGISELAAMRKFLSDSRREGRGRGVTDIFVVASFPHTHIRLFFPLAGNIFSRTHWIWESEPHICRELYCIVIFAHV